MRAVSLFSGAGGFEIGFDRAGIQTVVQVENDPWCREVLARHWPDTERVDDVRACRGSARRDADGPSCGVTGQRWEAGSGLWSSVDLIYGGFPCQDVSVAGQRAGLRGERSGLWSEFARVLSELRPRWTVVENVPGLLSSDGGRDFLRILMDLDELGYGVAWRILDGRWFGVPQRRRRVFLVGCLGDAARAAAVLAVCESCGGHPAASREAGQDVAFTLAGGSPETSRRISNGWNTTYLASMNNGQGEPNAIEDGTAFALQADAHNYVAATQSGGGHPESNMPGRHHEDDDNLVIQSEFDGRVRSDPRSLAAELALPITNRQGIGNPDVMNFILDGQNSSVVDELGPLHGHQQHMVASPVRASDGHHGWSGGRGDGADNLVYAGFYAHRGQNSDTCFTEDRVPPINSSQQPPSIMGAGVRRLTPLECERLMGWPDDWTKYTADGREIPDSHRYRLCGNGVIATVAEWLGHRLVEANRW